MQIFFFIISWLWSVISSWWLFSSSWPDSTDFTHKWTYWINASVWNCSSQISTICTSLNILIFPSERADHLLFNIERPFYFRRSRFFYNLSKIIWSVLRNQYFTPGTNCCLNYRYYCCIKHHDCNQFREERVYLGYMNTSYSFIEGSPGRNSNRAGNRKLELMQRSWRVSLLV